MTTATIHDTITMIMAAVTQHNLDIILIVTLMLLLLIKELIRAYDGPRCGKWMRILNFTLAPLLLLFGLYIIIYVVNIVTYI